MINNPLMVSLSNHERSSFDGLRMSELSAVCFVAKYIISFFRTPRASAISPLRHLLVIGFDPPVSASFPDVHLSRQ
jgi:hypothetical protein